MSELSVLAAARERPEATALVTPGGEWSWSELARRVATEMGALRRLGVGVPGGPPRVRVEAQVTPGFVVRFLALAQLGVTAVVLHPRWTAAERDVVAAADPVAWDLEVPVRLEPSRFLPLTTGGGVPASRPLAVVFTSGTGAAPRGVILSRAAFAASAAASAARLGWRQEDRWLLSLPPAHVGGLSILTRCLWARRAVVLAEAGDAGAALAAMVRHRVTLVSVVASQLDRLVAEGGPPPAVRAVLVGGGPCPPTLLRHARQRGWPVLATYGMSETCSQAATQVAGELLGPDDAAAPPLPGVELRVVEGRIQVRGAMLMSGYFPRGRHSEPFLDDGFLDTGDLGRLDDRGCLHVLGRADEVIVTGGENVSPVEVEAALLRVPGVAAALVLGVAAEPWGQVVAAVLVAAAGSPPGEERVLEALRDLAPFKRPRLVAWVDALPLLPGGKPSRRRAAAELVGLLRPLRRG